MKKQKIIILTSIIVAILMVAGFALVLNRSKYVVDYDEFESVVEYNGELDLESLVIYDKNSKKEVKFGEYEVVSCGETNSVGEKVVVIKYNNKTYKVNFTVKYKIEFKVDGEAIDTQYVKTAEEISLPSNPVKSGYEFVGWNQELPTTLTDNMVFEALFSSLDIPVPTLSTINAEYSTKLSEITLPSNEYGSWVFVDELTTTVGNLGKNTFKRS